MLFFLRIIFVPVVLIALRMPAYAQTDRANIIDYQKLEIRFIDLPLPAQKLELPVSSVIVHDNRFDTTAIGFIRATNKALFRLRLKNGFEKDITDYYQQHLSTDTGSQENTVLHCYIRKLQLTDAIIPREAQKSRFPKNYLEEKSGIHLKTEFYVQQDSIFIPLYRFDTTFFDDASIWTAGPAYLEQALYASLIKASRMNWQQVLSRGRRLSQAEIISYNEKRFQLPVLNEPPVKGVYMNFEAFLQNKPLEIAFTVKNSNHEDILYVKNQQGKDSAIYQPWGFYDGKDRYMLSAKNFFKLEKSANGFVLYGVNRITSGKVFVPVPVPGLFGGVGMSGFGVGKHLSNPHIFQLDLESGNIY